jgi:hypothetical protein
MPAEGVSFAAQMGNDVRAEWQVNGGQECARLQLGIGKGGSLPYCRLVPAVVRKRPENSLKTPRSAYFERPPGQRIGGVGRENSKNFRAPRSLRAPTPAPDSLAPQARWRGRIRTRQAPAHPKRDPSILPPGVLASESRSNTGVTRRTSRPQAVFSRPLERRPAGASENRRVA